MKITRVYRVEFDSDGRIMVITDNGVTDYSESFDDMAHRGWLLRQIFQPDTIREPHLFYAILEQNVE